MSQGPKSCCTPASTSALELPKVSTPLSEGCRTGQLPGKGLVADVIVEAREGSTDGMVRLEGGTFWMGNDDEDAWPEDGEGPVREVRVNTFWLDATAVTNAQFAAFVDATGYKTESERFGWSYVFAGQLPASRQRKLKAQSVQGLQWWVAIEGALWRKPEGSGSNIKKRLDHPVVHVSWNDAIAYCEWAGKRLATEAEWEFAARGGLDRKKYCWGDELTPEGKHRCNIWQGDFPTNNTAEDGYAWTAPAKSFRANGFGFYNMAGNVWEWVGDWFDAGWHVPARPDTRENPRGPLTGTNKVMRGGSFLCHESYCNRYRVGARTSNMPDTGTTNCGFRCARDV